MTTLRHCLGDGLPSIAVTAPVTLSSSSVTSGWGLHMPALFLCGVLQCLFPVCLGLSPLVALLPLAGLTLCVGS